jgi:DNA (cytosine-5)-methyltransferase 1
MLNDVPPESLHTGLIPGGVRLNGNTPGESIQPVALDLFCGAGGLSCGLAASFDVRAHLDRWPPAVSTLNANFEEQREPVDIAEMTAAELRAMAGGTPSVIAGGPPCQSFTSAGRRDASDHRATLVGVYARLAAEVRPPVVVFENVEGFVTTGGGRYVIDLLDPLIDAGYNVALRKVNLANYGVPQHRKRIIVVASLLGTPPFPAPTHSAWGAPGAQHVAGRPPTPNVEEALEGLALPNAPGAPQGHIARFPRDTEQRERVAALREGETMRDLPEDLWHESYSKRANRRVSDGTPSERRGGAPAGLRRLRRDEPSKAITSAAIREFVHPTANRTLTLREAARLQTFDDTFQFQGTANDQATLIGNAIPPWFATVLSAAVHDHVTAASGQADVLPEEGVLVEFTVTKAESMSPALARVVDAIRTRYRQERLFPSVLHSTV